MSFASMWAALADVGRDHRSGGYRRHALTGEDATLREWFAGEAAARGLDLTEDRAGNQWAWWGDPDADGPGVAVGSHLDSVPDGGAFDGPLGVVSAFAALDAVRAGGPRPARPIAVVHFGDEEGARFGIACAGSRILTGALAADRALGLTDADGVSMARALAAAGRDPAGLGPDPEALGRVGVFLELHVEQGRALAALDRPVAVGSGIWPHGRWRFDLLGEANHAGTTALADRHDPVLAMAATVLAVRSAAARHGALATCGKLAVWPNGVNAIPSAVRGWLDARAADAAAVRAVVAETAGVLAGFGGTIAEESWTGPTVFEPALAARLSAMLAGAPILATGAGHDAGILATAGISAGMLFVRNPTGVSHAPAEHAELADCLAGVAALTTALVALAGCAPAG